MSSIRGNLASMWDTSARLLRLLSLLQLRHEWSGPELAARLEVDVRTVGDIDRLRGLGYPVHSRPRRHGGLPPGTGHGAAAAAPGRRRGCGGGGRAAHRRRRDGGGHRGVVAAGPGQARAVLPARLRGDWRPCRRPPSPSPAPVPRSTPTTCRPSPPPAATTRCCASTTAATTAAPPVAPSSPRLVHTGRLWYLVGWDVDRRGPRTFRVDRSGRPIPVRRFAPRPPPADDIAAYVSQGTAVAAYPVQGRVTVRPFDVVAERVSPPCGPARGRRRPHLRPAHRRPLPRQPGVPPGRDGPGLHRRRPARAGRPPPALARRLDRQRRRTVLGGGVLGPLACAVLTTPVGESRCRRGVT